MTSVTPATITTGAGAPVTIRYTGTGAARPRILIFRVIGGRPRQVKNYAATTRAGASTWDGSLRGGKPAPPGTYVVAVLVTDKACTTSLSPVSPAPRRAPWSP